MTSIYDFPFTCHSDLNCDNTQFWTYQQTILQKNFTSTAVFMGTLPPLEAIK